MLSWCVVRWRARESMRWRMIRGGRVLVGGMRAVKPATVVDGEESIRVIEGESDDWASRGAHKLLGAVEAFEPFGLSIEGRRVLDAGASTGGFTDCALAPWCA